MYPFALMSSIPPRTMRNYVRKTPIRLGYLRDSIVGLASGVAPRTDDFIPPNLTLPLQIAAAICSHQVVVTGSPFN